ncbi:MAG: hypothetical protein B7X33_04450, partial [Lysobacterales bacterium 13-68-4]
DEDSLEDQEAEVPSEASTAEDERREQELEDAHHDQLASEMLAALDAFDPRGLAAASAEPAPVAEPTQGETDFSSMFAGLVDGREFGDASETESTDLAESVPEEDGPVADEAAESIDLHVEPVDADAIDADGVIDHADLPADELEAVSGAGEADALEPLESTGSLDAGEATEVEREAAPVVEEPAVEARVAAAEPEPELAETGDEVGELWRGNIDPDLLEVFTEEAREILDHADGALAEWRAEPSDLAQVPVLQRDLHTLKGGARIAGFVPVGDLSHASRRCWRSRSVAIRSRPPC